MTTRRRFIKKISAIGATAPLINNIEANTKKTNGPVILCSRGEVWGEKVLQPGWDLSLIHI